MDPDRKRHVVVFRGLQKPETNFLMKNQGPWVEKSRFMVHMGLDVRLHNTLSGNRTKLLHPTCNAFEGIVDVVKKPCPIIRIK